MQKCSCPVARELKEQGYTGSDQPIVRFFGQLRKRQDQARTFKQVDPTKETPVQVPPKRPPTALQVAHWITFKEEQRLDWQKDYLSRLCLADPGVCVSLDQKSGVSCTLASQAER